MPIYARNSTLNKSILTTDFIVTIYEIGPRLELLFSQSEGANAAADDALGE